MENKGLTGFEKFRNSSPMVPHWAPFIGRIILPDLVHDLMFLLVACLTAAPLPVNLERITLRELRATVRALKSGKAAGPDGVPIEFWKAILNSPCLEAAAGLLELCNTIWLKKEVHNLGTCSKSP